MLLRLDALTISVASETLIEDASVVVSEGNRIAIVGRNGSGKSTLLRVIADCGSTYVTVNAGGLSGDLAPRIDTKSGVVMVEQDVLVWSRLFPECSEEELSEMTLPEAIDTQSLAEAGDMNDEDAESWRRLSVAAHEDLNWRLADYDRTKIRELSPGSALRAYMAIALRRPSLRLILMDEPTNHLDLPSIIWLQHALIASRKTCIIVSHDETFLDTIADHVWEITDDASLVHSGARYSDYKEAKLKAIEEQRRLYDQQQKRHAKLSAVAEKLKAKSAAGERKEAPDHDIFQRGFRRNRAGRSGKHAKTVEKLRDKIEFVDAVKERIPLRLRLEPLPAGNDSALIANALLIGHQKSLPLLPLTLRIDFGERVALVGENAVGKSTFLQTLLGNLQPISGDVHRGRDLRVGILTQQFKELPVHLTPRAYVASIIDDMEAFAAGSRVIGYGLTRHQVESPICQLNPGARTRLLLAIFAMQKVNCLILDEPTNHLDEEAVSELISSLNTFNGTLLTVSHDRAFLGALHLSSIYTLSSGNSTTASHPPGLRRLDSLNDILSEYEVAVKRVIARSAL